MFDFIKRLFYPKLKITAGELAKEFNLELKGDPNTEITGIAPIKDATKKDIAFYSTERNSEAFKILPIEVLENTKASIILLQKEQIEFAPKHATLLITESPRSNIVKILGKICKEKNRTGIDFKTHIERGVYFRKKRSVYVGPFVTIEKGAVIEENVKIYASAFIGRNVIVGKGTVIHSGAHIENATIGENCVIYSNSNIGKDGFGYTRQNGQNIFIPHVGRVVLGNRVSIGASSCVDRGVMTDTKIGDGTKIDNLCQIAHGVVIGQECFLASGVGIAGGARIGNYVLIGGKCGITNNAVIEDNVEIAAGSGVTKSLSKNQKYMGFPAMPVYEYLRQFAWLKKESKK